MATIKNDLDQPIRAPKKTLKGVLTKEILR